MIKRGYIALSLIIIISVVVIIITTTSSLVGIGEGQASYSQVVGGQTLHFVEGCAEDGLLKARASSSYSGSTITRPEGTCVVTNTTGSNPRTLQASTTNSSYKKTIEVQYNRNATGLTIVSWKEM